MTRSISVESEINCRGAVYLKLAEDLVVALAKGAELCFGCFSVERCLFPASIEIHFQLFDPFVRPRISIVGRFEKA